MKAAVSQVLAIAALTFRSAVRSRVVVCLLAALAFVVLAVPATVHGDGTPLADARAVLSYTLALAVAIAAVTVLWASCGVVALDIQGRQIHLTAVKPVRALTLWAGRWLGVLALVAILLTAVGLAVTVMLHVSVTEPDAGASAGQSPARSILHPRLRVLPEPEDVSAEVAARVARLRSRGAIPAGVSDDELLGEVDRQIRAERSVVGPGRTRTWSFRLPATAQRGSGELRCRVSSASGGTAPLVGGWLVGPPSEARIAIAPAEIRRAEDASPVAIPAEALRGTSFVATFENQGPERSTTAIFHGGESVELLLDSSRFGPNLTRALLVVFFRLAALAALGVTAGCLFSFPVATFAAFALVTIIPLAHLSSFTARIPGEREGRPAAGAVTRVNRATDALLTAVERAVRPLASAHPVKSVAEGWIVPWPVVARTAAGVGVVVPLFLALAGGLAIGRRELASQ